MGQGWLIKGIKEVKKELSEWPEWKRTTTSSQQNSSSSKQSSSTQNLDSKRR